MNSSEGRGFAREARVRASKDKRCVQKPLFIVHSDACGRITPITNDNKNYFVLFPDEVTHYCVSYLITYKSDVFSAFTYFYCKE